MKRIHIVGRKNSGKTTLVVEIVEELVRRGMKVGTIKHTPHTHELDVPGKDSHRHRVAGGFPAAIVAKDLTAVFTPTDPDSNYYEVLERHFENCDLVIVEGDIESPEPKIEVWRQDTGTVPIVHERGDIHAVVTDDEIVTAVPVWGREDIGAICDKILAIKRG
ncbi:MAG TPA: molybdopterin-guanine dinucleotide biosynthesis protein B [bacterium]|jgi:molybdopterin-guanine dinucleotide biosynthesis protein MobB